MFVLYLQYFKYPMCLSYYMLHVCVLPACSGAGWLERVWYVCLAAQPPMDELKGNICAGCIQTQNV